MLDITLAPRHGNACGKIFPHTGYLGVTPVTISGKVALRPHDPVHLLAVRSITVTVKCHESRTFGGKEERTLWEKSKTVWTPEGEYEELGFWSKSFAMTIPVDAINFATSTQKTREWKTVWRVDLVVEHKPIQFVGHSMIKSYGLNLYNHTSPSVPPPSPPHGVSVGHDNYATQVFINSPHGAFGPGDNFTLSFYAKPDDPNTTIKKASVVLERRIETRERSPSPPSSSGTNALPTTSEKGEKGSTGSLFRRNISPRPFYGRLSSSNSSETSERAVVNKITDATTDQVIPGSGGTNWCHLNLALQKRGGHWDIAETCRTDITSVSFDLKVKIWIKSGRTTREFNCPPLPILITGVSMSERVAAQNAASAAAAAAAEAAAVAVAAAQASSVPVTPHKRKHRSSRRGLYMHEGTLDITEDLLGPSIPATPGDLTRRSKPKSMSERPVSSPISILPITGVVTDIRPILRASNFSNSNSNSDPTTTTGRLTITTPTTRPPNPPSISFVFPSILGGQPETPVLPPIQTLLETTQNTYSESYSIIHPYQQSHSHSHSHSHTHSQLGSGSGSGSGRRVSTTASEEDDQPLRSRPKLEFSLPTPTTAGPKDEFRRPSGTGTGPGTGTGSGLPSLDALGLGLPFVPDDERPRSRPRTAPMVSTFARHVPPPLSGQLSADVEDDRAQAQRPVSLATSHPTVARSTSGTFAFGLPTVPGPPLRQ